MSFEASRITSQGQHLIAEEVVVQSVLARMHGPPILHLS